jgi:hypothetical protein
MRQAPVPTVLIGLLLTLLPLAPSAIAEPALRKSAEQETERDRELDAMIDALANRVNTAPKIQGDGPRNPVFFNEEYDGKEQVRVFRAAQELKKRDGNEPWPRLAAHVNDERYALTWQTGTGINRNMTIGMLCALMAKWDLNLAFERLSPTKVEDGALGTRRIVLVKGPDFGDKRFLEWCEKREGMELYEMQIDILEWTITEPPALRELSEAQRDEYIGKAKAEIERLKKTHEPVIDDKKLNNSYYTLLSEKRIKAYRDER